MHVSDNPLLPAFFRQFQVPTVLSRQLNIYSDALTVDVHLDGPKF